MAAIGYVMHKIIRIVFGMLKNMPNFNPEIDKINQNKSKPKVKKITVSKNRRYQPYDDQAPISRRHGNKRKKEEKSHIVKLQ